ncbi:MAG: TetR/AcrR family transcriptional regulator [Phycisphaerales bacterium JB038]
MAPNTDTKDRILDAAADLFWKQGYTATGVAQILKAADAKSGSLYYFFPTKEDLLLAVLERYKDLLWPLVIQPAFERVSDPIERIFAVLDGYRRMLLSTKCRSGCPIGNLALELADTHPAARELIAENFTGWRQAIEGCLDEAAERLPADVDRMQLAAYILTVLEGGLMQAKTYRALEPFESAVAQLRDHLERLLADGADWTAPRSKQPRRSASRPTKRD